MAASKPLTIADRALLSALRGWSGAAKASIWNSFSPAWREMLQAGWNHVAHTDPEALRHTLRAEHAAESRPDLARVHSSWWVRALKDESPAVQRAVAAGAPGALREPLRRGLNLGPDDLVTDRSPHAAAVGAALALWSERLIGDWPERDDPPVIRALTRLDLRDLTRLIHALGLAKHALAGVPANGLRRRDREWIGRFQDAVGALHPRFVQQARSDVAMAGAAGRHALERLGLMTVARLLETAEPYRVRWALQHVPYTTAKFTRTVMSQHATRDAYLAACEAQALEIVWDRLRDEGRIKDARGGSA